jgi:hypothetical protein
LETRRLEVLVIESDAARRTAFVQRLCAIGIAVTSVASICEIERWPTGDVVVTDATHFTPFWVTVGATHVVVITDSDADGIDVCRRGATAWVPRSLGPEGLVDRLQEIGVLKTAAISCPSPRLSA